MADYKLKDKKISIWYYTTEKVSGVNVKTYHRVTPAPIWSYYRITGGAASIQGSAVKFWNSVEDCIFVINHYSDWTPDSTMIVIFKHKIYDVKYVDDFEGYTTDIKLNCKLATDQNFSKYNGLVDD